MSFSLFLFCGEGAKVLVGRVRGTRDEEESRGGRWGFWLEERLAPKKKKRTTPAEKKRPKRFLRFLFFLSQAIRCQLHDGLLSLACVRCCSNSREKRKRTSACAARAGRIRAACDDVDADVDGIIEEGEEEKGDESVATRAAEEGESRAARIRV